MSEESLDITPKELEDLRHINRMVELAYARETERLKCEWTKEINRIKSAEIRKAEERRWLQQNGRSK